ncbi:MAG TPA: DUF2065 domain-containing protein [Hypericibacter adhaerens]|jgi:uncharacterized protein YjeT (DUF2065 family)|uniref:DUF2065 domain-containing protein n=1 Tax=Hypericibacter adhaerens TaxID=2602016 RepID=A0A5J6MYD4_9PROT|nr:DUF2065 domain-containing protein [Hypericibacter adhaerens]QEX21290.1 hypothetical protein FRZ61_12140 [Hypericibacter adhaerens]HWA45504.1 DUF2065 domain-containing protein [Hypericibacter adhaerens]
MSDLATALGLVLVIEGVTLALFPGMLRRLAETLAALPDTAQRAGGLAAAGIGLLLVWLVRG